MRLKDTTRKKLDRFAPYGSAIGAFLGYLIIPMGSLGVTLPWYYLPFSNFLFPYLLCTCIHRKYLVYCSAAIVGALGAYLGFSCGTLLLAPLLVHAQLPPFTKFLYGLIALFISSLFAFIFSWYMCKRAQRKEVRKVQ